MNSMTKPMHVDRVVRSLEHTVNTYIQELEPVSLEQLLWQPAPNEWSLGQMIMHLIGSAQGMHLANVRQCLALGKQSAQVQEREKLSAGNCIEAVRVVQEEAHYVEKTAQSEALFQYGSFPAERIHVPPSPQYTPLQPDNKMQLKEGLQETMRQMAELAPAVRDVWAKLAITDSVEKCALEIANGISLHEGMTSNTVDFAGAPGVQDSSGNHASAHSLSLPTVAHPRLGGLNAWEWFWLVEMHYRHHIHQQQRLEEAWTYEQAAKRY